MDAADDSMVALTAHKHRLQFQPGARAETRLGESSSHATIPTSQRSLPQLAQPLNGKIRFPHRPEHQDEAAVQRPAAVAQPIMGKDIDPTPVAREARTKEWKRLIDKRAWSFGKVKAGSTVLKMRGGTGKRSMWAESPESWCKRVLNSSKTTPLEI